ncbi:MAG: hypothetical protein GQ557_01680 [Mycoplasmataceae bacterium]|nr:hypothetical protein [Mycoplasmataceae bacterium]
MKKLNVEQSFEKMSSAFGSVGAKLSNQKHLSAIRDGFAAFLPFLMVGSFALMINSVLIDPNGLLATLSNLDENGQAYDNWVQASFYLSPIFNGIYNATMGYFALYASFLLAYFLAGSYGENKLFGGLLGMVGFLLLQPTNAGETPESFFSATGIMFAMIAGLTMPMLFHWINEKWDLKIKMPDGVPPTVVTAFEILIPIMLTILLYGLIQPTWGAFAYLVGFGKITTDHVFYNLQFDVTYQLSEGGEIFTYDNFILQVDQETSLYIVIQTINYLDINNPGWWNNLSTDFQGLLIFYIEQIIINQVELQEPAWIIISLNANNNTLSSITAGPITEILNSINKDWYYIINATNSLIVLPIQNIADSAWFIWIYLMLMTSLFFFGIHGPNVLAPIANTLYVTASIQNVAVLQAYGTIPLAIASGELAIFTDMIQSAFVTVGGTGATFALLIAVAIFSKSPSTKEIGKLSSSPGLFNINEPMIFGVPLMLNPIYCIPFILIMPINGLLVYLIIAAGIMNPSMYIIPWTTPLFLSGMLVTADWVSIPVTALVFFISFFGYLPFVLLDAKTQAKKQLSDGNNETYNKLNIHQQNLNSRYKNDKTNNLYITETKAILKKISIIQKQTSDQMYFEINVKPNHDDYQKGINLIANYYAKELDFKNKKSSDLEKQDYSLKSLKKDYKTMLKQTKLLGKKQAILTKMKTHDDKIILQVLILKKETETIMMKINIRNENLATDLDSLRKNPDNLIKGTEKKINKVKAKINKNNKNILKIKADLANEIKLENDKKLKYFDSKNQKLTKFLLKNSNFLNF